MAACIANPENKSSRSNFFEVESWVDHCANSTTAMNTCSTCTGLVVYRKLPYMQPQPYCKRETFGAPTCIRRTRSDVSGRVCMVAKYERPHL